MNYEEALKFITSTSKFSINLGLGRVKRLCELLGNPQKDLKIIHVAGTNGKGSVTTFIASMLQSQGYKVGIYTSPYIERFTERIKINDEEISKDDVAEYVNIISGYVNTLEEEKLDAPTEFEIITACAFKYFKDKNVDYVVLEVGLGGRFDATNIVDPVLSVITSISLDHTKILGDTLGKIAYEKAGIIKKDKPVVVYPQEEEAMKVIEDYAKEMNSKIYKVNDLNYSVESNNLENIVFDLVSDQEYKQLKINMVGDYQVLNAITAVRAIEIFKQMGNQIETAAIYKGLSNAKWPGRFEIISKNPYIILDGAHNPQGVDALTASIKKYFSDKKINIVCGILEDKNYPYMIERLSNVSHNFVTVKPNSERALSPDKLAEIINNNNSKAQVADNIKDAVKIGTQITKADEVLVFCGSLYMIGEVRTILMSLQ